MDKLDSYDNVHVVVSGELIYDHCPILGVFTTLEAAVSFVEEFDAEHPHHYDGYDITAWSGPIEIPLLDEWKQVTR